MKIAAFLMSLVEPILSRILVALGFSVVSVVGVTASIEGLKSQLVSSVNTMPVDILNVFLLAGGGDCLGLILGAISFRLAFFQIKAATKILGVNPG